MSRCEAGIEISAKTQCPKCGAFPSESCRGSKPPHVSIQIIADLRKQLTSAQAKIDSLMLEYCPDEMSDTQTKNWEKYQVAAKEEE